jgi:HK97 family phage portal protein
VGFLSRILGFQSAVVVYAQPNQYATSVDPYEIPSVVRAIQLISTDIARLPVHVENADGERIDSPVTELLTREASRWQTGFDFRRYLTSQALSSGNGIALIRRDNNGAIAELTPIAAGMTTALIDDDGVHYKIAGAMLEADQVLHIGCYPNIRNPAWYRSPIDSCTSAFALAADENAAHAALVKTGSTGKVVISHPGAMSDQLVEAIRDSWKNIHATAEGASRPLILREGMKAEKISQETSSSMIESRRFSVQEVARAFGVPPEMLWQQGGGALSSQAETMRAYCEGGIMQWVRCWEAELTRKMLPPGQFLKFETDALLLGNFVDKVDAFQKAVMAGIMAPNEARVRVGLPPLDDLDDPKPLMPGAGSAQQAEVDSPADKKNEIGGDSADA